MASKVKVALFSPVLRCHRGIESPFCRFLVLWVKEPKTDTEGSWRTERQNNRAGKLAMLTARRREIEGKGQGRGSDFCVRSHEIPVQQLH